MPYSSGVYHAEGEGNPNTLFNGRDEAIKGYWHYLTGGGKPYTEAQLSDKGYRNMLAVAYSALERAKWEHDYGSVYDNRGDGIGYTDYAGKDSTDLHNLVGMTSGAGLSKVRINKKPYVQIRDLYDFDDDVEIGPFNALMALQLLAGSREGARRAGVNLGQTIGRPFGINMLFPENPAQTVSPSELERYRQITGYRNALNQDRYPRGTTPRAR